MHLHVLVQILVELVNVAADLQDLQLDPIEALRHLLADPPNLVPNFVAELILPSAELILPSAELILPSAELILPSAEFILPSAERA
jgi:hypothetical protein